MEARKQFSRIGLVMFLGTLLIYGVQILVSLIIKKVPAIIGNIDLSYILVYVANLCNCVSIDFSYV